MMMSKLVIRAALGLCLVGPVQALALEVVLVVGLAGGDEYQDVFQESVEQWQDACASADVDCQVIGQVTSGDEKRPQSRLQLKQALTLPDRKEALWVVLIGHGTFDGRATKFNVASEDFTAKEFGAWCAGIESELVVINTASASSPFVRELQADNRTIITATKSPAEIYYTRFGSYFSEAIGGLPKADLDNDKQVSLLEAFIYSATKVEQFYTDNGRLATEHALIDDNGDGLATRAEWFEGVAATKAAKQGAEPDGLRAMQQVLVKNHQERNFPPQLRKRRDDLERQVRKLRRNKAEIAEDDYYSKLETLLGELANIYAEVDTSP